MNVYLFDLDGTLIDSLEDIAASANVAREAVGLPPRPVSDIKTFIGDGAQRLIERTLGEAHAARVPEALEAWRRHYETHLLDRTCLYPGIVEALESLDGLRGVVTNKPGPLARTLISELGLARLCPVVVGGGDTPRRKPDPDGVHRALELLGCAGNGSTVLVGDSGIDAAAARAAGVRFVGVLWGFRPRQELEAEGARTLAERPDQLSVRVAEALALP